MIQGSIYEAADEDARLERFYRQWALKEAFIKAIGSGLTMSPRRIEIVNLDNTPRPNSDKVGLQRFNHTLLSPK